MNILVISDTHLAKFNKKRFNYLKTLIEEHDKVIINGDFYEGYMYSLKDFAKTKWSALFPLLKSKQTVYIYGNHDPDAWNTQEERSILNTFSNEQYTHYNITMGGTMYHIEHGHLLFPFWDTKYNIVLPRLVMRPLLFLDNLMGSVVSKKIYYGIAKFYNSKLKLLLNTLYNRKNTIYVVGHTHWGELDIAQNFVNAGVNKHNYGQYVTITENSVSFTTVPKFNFDRQIRITAQVIATNEDTSFSYSY